MSTALKKVKFDRPLGVVLSADPAELQPGYLADCCNCDVNAPTGLVRPRRGSRSLADPDSVVTGGHPSNPVGHDKWDFTARAYLCEDDAARRVWVLAQKSAAGGVAKMVPYIIDLTQRRPGAAGPADPDVDCFDLPEGMVPSMAIYGGILYVAGGDSIIAVSAYDDEGVTRPKVRDYSNLSDPEQPPQPTWQMQGNGTWPISTGYLYRYCYFDPATGARSQMSPVSALTADSTGAASINVLLTLSALTGPPGSQTRAPWTHIELYRTTDGGDVFRKLTTIEQGDDAEETYEYYDSTRDDRLSTMTMPTTWGRPPAARFILVHGDRMLFFGQLDDENYGHQDLNVVYYSEPYCPLNTSPENSLTIRPHDGGSITGAVRLYNRVYALKSNGAVYELAGNLPNSVYRVDPIVNEGGLGCAAHATVKEIEGRALWLSRQGIVLFDGESIRRLSQPIEQVFVGNRDVTAPAESVQRDPPPPAWGDQHFEVLFHQGDVVSERMHFQFRLFAAQEANPDTDTPVEAWDTTKASDRERVMVSGACFPADGLLLAPDTSVALRAYPSLAQSNVTYWMFRRAWDGHGYTDWSRKVYRLNVEVPLTDEGLNWSAVARRAFAIDSGQTHEYWLWLPGESSDDVDVVWVLDTDTILAESGPQWRRHLIPATHACTVNGLNMGDTGPLSSMNTLLLADNNGCLWVGNWPGQIDHLIGRAAPLSPESREGTGVVEYDDEDEVWTLTPDTSPGWSVDDLQGELVVLHAGDGRTWTGIVVANTADAMTVGRWLEGIEPEDAEDLEYSLGGIAAFLDYHSSDFEEPDQAKQAKVLTVIGSGDEARMEAVLRMGDEPGATQGTRSSDIRRQLRSVTCARGERRHLVKLRGIYVGLKIGTWRQGASWRLASWGLEYAACGGTR